MKFIIALGLTSIILLTVCSCKTNKKNTKEKDRNDNKEFFQENNFPILISLRRGSCRGNCRRYEVKIFENRIAVYIGKRNVDKIGKYKCQVNEEDLSVLKKIFEDLNFERFDDEYLKKGVADLQMIMISYGEKTIKYHNRTAPKELIACFEKIESEFDKLNWKKVD